MMSPSKIATILPDPHACSQFIMFEVSSILNSATHLPWNNLQIMINIQPIFHYSKYNKTHPITCKVMNSCWSLHPISSHRIPPFQSPPHLSLDTGWSQSPSSRRSPGWRPADATYVSPRTDRLTTSRYSCHRRLKLWPKFLEVSGFYPLVMSK